MVVDLIPADANTNHCLRDHLELIELRMNALHNGYQGQEFIISGKSDIAYQQGPIMTMCSLREPITVYPKDNVVMVRLITSPNKSGSKHKGIKLQYSTIKCIPNYTELQGRIIARASSNCTSLIAVPSNRTISISLSYFHPYVVLDSESDCNEQKVEIRDGNATSSPVISTICRDNKINPIFSTGPYLLILVITTYDLEFSMQYFSTDAGQGCGGIINAQEGTVYSPLYPSTYRSVKTCEWIITTSSGSLLNLNFDAFDLGSRLTCNKNYLEIFDRDGFSARHYCGDDNPALYTSRDNYVKLVYHTALNNGGIGWHATFNGTRIASRGL